MTSDSQRAGYEPDDTASGANWAPPRTDRAGAEAPLSDRTPQEFGWATPDVSWQVPGNSWTIAYPDAGADGPERQTGESDRPGSWPPPLDPATHHPSSLEPSAKRAPGGSPEPGPDRGDDLSGLPQRIPGRLDLPPDGPDVPDRRQEQTVRAPRATVPAPPPPLPPQATRIPGASLAADPPMDYSPPEQYESPVGRYQYPAPPGRGPATTYDVASERPAASPERWDDHHQPPHIRGDDSSGLATGQGRARVRPEAAKPTWEPPPPYLPGSPTGPEQQYDQSAPPFDTGDSPAGGAARVPSQRSAQSEGGDSAPARRPVSASAAVPAASRVSPPPNDPTAGSRPSEPKVYGRPAAGGPGDRHLPDPDRSQHDVPHADRAADREPFWHTPPSDREARPSPRPTAQPRDGDARPDSRPGVPQTSDRPGRATAFAKVPVPPPPAAHPHDPQGLADRPYARPDGPAPEPRESGGPATGYARPPSSDAGVAHPPRVAPHPPSDEAGARPPMPWDQQPPQYRWGGHPDQTQMDRPRNGPQSEGARPDDRPGAWGEGPPIGRALAPGTARLAGRATDDRRPVRTSGPESGRGPALAWADHNGGRTAGLDNVPPLERPAEPPPAQVRNARILAMVLVAAVLLLAVPLGTLWLLGRTSSDAFNPAVGSCVKQDGTGAVATGCGDAGAYTVVAKANDPGKCDPKQPHIVLQNVEGDNVLCLRPAAGR
jgi:hypothetical protein